MQLQLLDNEGVARGTFGVPATGDLRGLMADVRLVCALWRESEE